MPILNPPNTLPNAMWVVVDFLSRRDGSHSSAETKSLLSPDQMIGRRADETLDHSVKGLRDLNLVVDDGNVLALAGPASEQETWSPARFRKVLRAAVLRPGQDIWASGVSGPHDLVRALAWWVLQDPYDPPIDWDRAERELLPRQLASREDWPFSNSTWFDAFGRWASALGFATLGVGGGLVPDITTAVRDEMPAVADGTVDLLTSALRALRARLPVVDGGMYWQQLVPRVVGPAVLPGENALGAVLSHALLRCADEGTIELMDQADPPSSVLLVDPDGTHRHSHLRLVESA